MGLQPRKQISFVAETMVGEMIASGPWSSALARVMVDCAMRHVPQKCLDERRKNGTLDTIAFTGTDISLSTGTLRLNVVVGTDSPAGKAGRRKKSYWVFGSREKPGVSYPITQHDTIVEAVRMMVDLIKDVMALNARPLPEQQAQGSQGMTP